MTDATEGESTWDRLRRRKVVQWGIAYSAGAWGFLQGLAYVSELLEWPAQLQKLMGLALLIGLPVVLVLAWYHGDRGEQRVRRTELAILTLLFLLGGGIFWRYQHTTESTPPTAATGSATTGAPAVADAGPSIAVLPFENRSRVEDDAFFVDGIHDDILTQLSKVSALKVISRTSVEQFRDTKLPMKAIAEQLGVKSILEGGVQRAGERVRITVQLIDAGTDAHVWAETYDRELTAENIFVIQTELAAAIAGALSTTLTPAEQARVSDIPTQSLEAWQAYQLGQQRLDRSTSDSLDDAERFFRQAIALDTNFALAHAWLAETIRSQTNYNDRPSLEGLAEAERHARTSIKLDPELAEGWAFLGSIALGRGQPEVALQELMKAVELRPNFAMAHLGLSGALAELGRRSESLDHAMRALQLDPLSLTINNAVGYKLDEMGRFDEATARYRRSIEIDPDSPIAYLNLGFLQAYAWNRFPEAVPLIERSIELDTGAPSLVGVLAFVLLDMNEDEQSAAAMAEAVRRAPDSVLTNMYAVWYYSTLGDAASAEANARKVLEVDPRDTWSLAVLRNADARTGDLQSARTRYASAYPEFLTSPRPRVDTSNYFAAIDFAYVLQRTGEHERASALLDGSEVAIRGLPRLGSEGFAFADIQIHALRGDKAKALAALRDAADAGWRSWWRYLRDFDPNVASIRNEPEFKAVFADIERDMARQRAELAARPKDAPLDLGSVR